MAIDLNSIRNTKAKSIQYSYETPKTPKPSNSTGNKDVYNKVLSGFKKTQDYGKTHGIHLAQGGVKDIPVNLAGAINTVSFQQGKKLMKLVDLPGLPSLDKILQGKYGKNYEKSKAYKTGELLGYLAPTGLEGISAKVASKVLPKAVTKSIGYGAAKSLGKKAVAKEIGKSALKSATEGAILGSLWSAGNEAGRLANGEKRSGKDIAKSVAENTLYNALFGGALGGIAGGVKAKRSKAYLPLINQTKALPGGEQRLALPSNKLVRQQKVENKITTVQRGEGVVTPYGETPKALPQPGAVAWAKDGKPIFGLPAQPKVSAKAFRLSKASISEAKRQASLSKLENLFAEAKKRGIIKPNGSLANGRSDLELESLWSQMAGSKEQSLNDLIDSALPNSSTSRNITTLMNQGHFPQASSLAEKIKVGLNNARYIQQNADAFGAYSKNPLIQKQQQTNFRTDSKLVTDTVQSVKPTATKGLKKGKKPNVQQEMQQPITNAIPQQTNIDIIPPKRESAIPQKVEQTNIIPTEPKTYNAPKGKTSIQEITDLKNTYNELQKQTTKIENEIAKKGDSPELASAFNRYVEQLNQVEIKIRSLSTNEIHFNDNEFTKENIKNFVDIIANQVTPDAIKRFGGSITSGKNFFKNIYNVSKDMFKNENNPITRNILKPILLGSKHENAAIQDAVLTDFTKRFYDKYKFRASSPESAAIQDFGEGKMTYDELVKKFGTEKADGIVEADKWFGKIYENLLKRMNESIIMLEGKDSPNIIPRRQDYYHHIIDLGNNGGIFDLFNFSLGTNKGEFMSTIRKFGFMKKRTSDTNYISDAIGALEKYLPFAAHTITMNKARKVFFELGNSLEDRAPDMADFFKSYANSIGGEGFTISKNRQFNESVKMLDKLFAAPTRKAQLFFNLGTTISQFANLPFSAGEAGYRNFMKGIGQTLYQTKFFPDGNVPINMSRDARERFLHLKYWKIGPNTFKDKTRFAKWMLTASDKIAYEISWNAFRNKAIKEGIKNPEEYASKMAKELNPSREIGDMPLIFQDRLVNALAAYSYEPMQQLGRIYRNIGEKQFKALAKTILVAYIGNAVYQNLTGHKTGLDIGGATKDALTEKGVSPTQRAGRFVGEVAGNVPLLPRAITTFSPDNKIFNMSYRQFFGESDPTRFNNDSLFIASLVNTIKSFNSEGFGHGVATLASSLIPGGSQAKKTIEGSLALSRNGKFKNGKMYFPIDKNPINAAKTLAFGSSASKEANKFYSTRDIPKPLSKSQTKEVLSSSNQKLAYKEQILARELRSLQSRYKQSKNQKEQLKLSKRFDEVQKEYSKVQQKLGKYSF